MHRGCLEPAFGGNRRRLFFLLVSPAEGAGALAPARFKFVAYMRAYRQRHGRCCTVRTTTTTTSLSPSTSPPLPPHPTHTPSTWPPTLSCSLVYFSWLFPSSSGVHLVLVWVHFSTSPCTWQSVVRRWSCLRSAYVDSSGRRFQIFPYLLMYISSQRRLGEF